MSNPNIGTPIIFDPPEKVRTYNFSCGEKVVLKDVTELVVRASGTHRLKTEDGKSHIVAPGWLHIELEIENWTI